MNYKEKIPEMLRGFKTSLGVRSLNLEEQAILKVSIITRNDVMIETMEKLLAEEKAGKEIDLIFLKGVIEEFSGKHDGGQIREVKEAAAKREEDAYLESLMKQFDK
jgi:hypothetical protein